MSLIKWHIDFLCTLNGHGQVIDRGQISQVVIQDAHARHVLTYHDLLGFLDCLLHVEMLLLSGVSREDSELVELDAVLKRQPGTNAKAFVRLAIHANPGVLGVHLVHNLVPLHLHLANDETTEQLVHLQGLCDCKFAHGLEVLLDLGELLPSLILLDLRLAFVSLEERF
jgi:hypothetical protein